MQEQIDYYSYYCAMTQDMSYCTDWEVRNLNNRICDPRQVNHETIIVSAHGRRVIFDRTCIFLAGQAWPYQLDKVRQAKKVWESLIIGLKQQNSPVIKAQKSEHLARKSILKKR